MDTRAHGVVQVMRESKSIRDPVISCAARGEKLTMQRGA
jgi:hypothetical protein